MKNLYIHCLHEFVAEFVAARHQNNTWTNVDQHLCGQIYVATKPQWVNHQGDWYSESISIDPTRIDIYKKILLAQFWKYCFFLTHINLERKLCQNPLAREAGFLAPGCRAMGYVNPCPYPSHVYDLKGDLDLISSWPWPYLPWVPGRSGERTFVPAVADQWSENSEKHSKQTLKNIQNGSWMSITEAEKYPDEKHCVLCESFHRWNNSLTIIWLYEM